MRRAGVVLRAQSGERAMKEMKRTKVKIEAKKAGGGK
jgi:hypothetical protein